MEFIFELVLQFLGELLLQCVAEALGELGLHALGAAFRPKRHPVLAALGYALWGGLAGLISLVVVRKSLIVGHTAQLAGILIIPALSGTAMALVGRWRSRRGQALVGLDHFTYAFIFAFCMTLVRFKVLA